MHINMPPKMDKSMLIPTIPKVCLNIPESSLEMMLMLFGIGKVNVRGLKTWFHLLMHLKCCLFLFISFSLFKIIVPLLPLFLLFMLFCIVSVAMHVLVQKRVIEESRSGFGDFFFSLYKTLKSLLHYSLLQPQDTHAHTLNHWEPASTSARVCVCVFWFTECYRWSLTLIAVVGECVVI